MTTKNVATPSAIAGLGLDSLVGSTKVAIQVWLFSLGVLGAKTVAKEDR